MFELIRFKGRLRKHEGPFVRVSMTRLVPVSGSHHIREMKTTNVDRVTRFESCWESMPFVYHHDLFCYLGISLQIG